MLVCELVRNSGVLDMAGLLGAAGGGIRGVEIREENEISLREMPNPLQNLKTAKSGIFLARGYQRLSKARDFGGETIPLRLGFARNIGGPVRGRSGGPKNFTKSDSRQMSSFCPLTP